jgi:exodeoxyribonuclease VII large subunit
VLAGLERRGWAGRVVWAFAPVQDRRAAPAITRALTDLAAIAEVEIIVVARGGGSLADLFAFCDETLCRTIAMLRVPVISSVGHHADRTLIDDVAAVACSTPTHAAETAVPLHCGEARGALGAATRGLSRHADRVLAGRAAVSSAAGALARHARRAVITRARELAAMSRAPGEHVARQRRALHQSLREMRASATRRVAAERATNRRAAAALQRRAAAASGPDAAGRRAALESLTLALAAHDPERVVERGYTVVDDRAGNVITSAEAARAAGGVRLFFADAAVDATVSQEEHKERE